MKRTCRRLHRGHVRAAVAVAIVSLALGGLTGYWASRFVTRGPSAQSVLDFLAKPLPVPKGAELLGEYGGVRGLGMWSRDEGETFIEWRTELALDVTGVKPDLVDGIAQSYESRFQKQFPMQGEAGGGRTSLVKSSDGFSLMMGVDPGWRHSYAGRNFDFVIDAEVLDFESNTPAHSMAKRQVVRDLSAPPALGQRVLHLRMKFRGRGLTGWGKWPQTPASAPPANAGL